MQQSYIAQTNLNGHIGMNLSTPPLMHQSNMNMNGIGSISGMNGLNGLNGNYMAPSQQQQVANYKYDHKVERDAETPLSHR